MTGLDWDGPGYHLVYALARRLMELDGVSAAWGRDRERATRDREGLLAAAARDYPTVARELRETAVDDAMSRRRPRW